MQFVKLYNRYKRFKLSTNHNWVPPKLNLIGQITLYLLPAMIIFIFFPAMLFTYFEGYTFISSNLSDTWQPIFSHFSHQVGTTRFQFITLLSRWQPLVNFFIKFQSEFKVCKERLCMRRFWWLCAHVSTPPRANFWNLLRFLSAFYPPMVYNRYVCDIFYPHWRC